MLRNATCFSLLILIFVTSCSHKTQPTSTKVKTDKNAVLTISFISYGSGIDYTQLMKIDSLIQSNKRCSIQVEKKNWGKEGEVDYCFFSEDPNCIQEWKKLLQQELNIKDRVQLMENKKWGEGH